MKAMVVFSALAFKLWKIKAGVPAVGSEVFQ
jgi:hypothetical protein